MKRLFTLLAVVHGGVRWVSRHTWTTGTIALILLALVGVFARLWLPFLEGYRSEAEHWLGETLGQPVSIGRLTAEWRGWAPEVSVENLRLLDREGGEIPLQLRDARIRIDPLASLLTLTPQPERLIISGLRFSILRTPEGEFRLRGLQGRTELDPALSALILGQDRLEIHADEIIWHDQTLGTPPVTLTEASLRLRNSGARHKLVGEAVLPESFGERASFVIDLQGNPLTTDWSAQSYLAVSGLQLRPLLTTLAVPGLEIAGGRSDARLWGTWEGARLKTLDGEFSTQAPALAVNGQHVRLNRADGLLRLRRDGEDWALTLDRLHLATEQGDWQQNRVELTLAGPGGDAPGRITGRVRYLRLQDILPSLNGLISLGPALEAWLSAARPAGEVRDLVFVYTPAGPPETRLALKARVDDLALVAAGKQPGIRGLAGTLIVQGARGQFSLADYPVELNLPELFDGPLSADSVSGTLRWHREEGGRWVMRTEDLALANADIRTSATAELSWAQGEASPFVSLIAHFEDINLEVMPRYLPVGKMTNRLENWFKRAIPSGRITTGSALLRGRTADFPFDHGEGRFEVRGNITDAILDYARAWPRLEEVDAELVVDGRSLRLHSPTARIFDAEILEVDARIPDMSAKRPVLEVRGNTKGSGNDGLRFLRESPLADKLGQTLDGWSIDGDVSVALELGIPLKGRDRTPRIEGSVLFDGNRLIDADLGLDLADVRGKYRFTRTTVSGRDLTARLRDLPVVLTVETVADPDYPVTRVRIEGSATADYLARLFEDSGNGGSRMEALLLRIQGETTWRATLDVPQKPSADGPYPTLRFESDLDGLAVALPEPLGKPPKKTRRLEFGTVLTGDSERTLRVGYGDNVKAVLRFRQTGQGPELDRGAVYLGNARGELPSTGGLEIIGDLDKFSSTEWLDVLSPTSGEAEPAGALAAPTGRNLPAGALRRLEISARQFEILGQWLKDLRLDANLQDNGTWRARLSGRSLAGTLTVPSNSAGGPISMVFDRMALPGPSGQDLPASKDPRELPALKFSCHDFSFDDISMGTLTLVTRPHPGGLRIEQLKLVGPSFEVQATGDWWFHSGEHLSRFKIRLDSPNLGDMLNDLGYDTVALKGGRAHLTIDAGWNGSPSDFALSRINGVLKFEAEDGRLEDVPPGPAGRVFGLLSLQALPRRLKLDFRDLFKKGLTYDHIQGHFTISDGDAYTNDLQMTTPSAHINIAGRVGLASQDYDQTVTVTPDVSSTTLPLAGMIAGGPIGAAVGFVAEKVFKREIDAAVKHQYTVTGSWKDPSIARIGHEPPHDPPSEGQPFFDSAAEG